jgi:hypothetical protein
MTANLPPLLPEASMKLTQLHVEIEGDARVREVKT